MIALAAALAERDEPVVVCCDAHEGSITHLERRLSSVTIQTMRGEQPRHSRRPRAFQTWVQSHIASHEGAVLSTTPVVTAPLWYPGLMPRLDHIRRERQRSSAIATVFKTRRWILPRLSASRRAIDAWKTSPGTLLAHDAPAATTLAATLEVDAATITTTGRASRWDASSNGCMAAREDARAALGVDSDTRLALLSTSRPDGGGATLAVDAMASARQAGHAVDLLVTGFQMHALVRHAARCGVSAHLHAVGATRRFDVLFAASDVVLLPGTPCGPYDEAMIVDALAHGRPVVAGADAPGSSLIDASCGIIPDADTPEAWADAIVAAPTSIETEAPSLSAVVDRILDAAT